VLTKELAYYRAHFREAVQKDGVICLECGAIFKYLPGHLCKHNLSSDEYRAKWGYNRTTPLERLITRRKKRRNALAMKLASLSPHGSIKKAIKAKRGRALPYRPESRLIQTEAARARVASGLRQVPQRHVPNDGVELSKEDRQVLSLRNRGLWPSEIAALLGIRVQSVRWRLERLTKAGFTFPPPSAPRPIPHRKVTDDELLTLARSGLSIPEIAVKVGMATPTVHKRIKRLQERG
jgi:DNA-directed RNA polymerase specialized sigma24 family protein